MARYPVVNLAQASVVQPGVPLRPDLTERLGPSKTIADIIAVAGIASGFGYVLLSALGVIK